MINIILKKLPNKFLVVKVKLRIVKDSLNWFLAALVAVSVWLNSLSAAWYGLNLKAPTVAK